MESLTNDTSGRKLFTPVDLGAISLAHRVAHAPTTRLRSNPDDSPSEMMAKYYGQRASRGGLIIIEAANVSMRARGYLGAPSLFDDSQIEGFRRIADAVHAKGGKVVAQICHDGRTSHTDLTGGVPPLGPSVIPFNTIALTKDGWQPVSQHVEATIDDIKQVVREFRDAARRAFDAGVDGVEIHSANGYLLDSFIHDGSNKRTDGYGGSIDNRARLLMEVIEATAALRGADRIGVRLSPSGEWNDMFDSDPGTTFGRGAELLNQFDLSYLHLIEPRIKGDDTKAGAEEQEPVAAAQLRQVFNGKIIAAGGFVRDSAEAILQRGDADAVAFGRWFSSNPDLPYRLKHHLPLTPYVRDGFWGGSEKHYTDFPAMEPANAAESLKIA
ncbi:alkene reductase [Cupriavidus sp. CV2]|uniref:alkene reductase n=1 Tax=Cupriavidus ulmosensis TaxID=3065913 RepID=UPI00296B30F3|nr:alkene reductase [Cupriavidus sp. CV2]MDW3686866.1 alkene reductase [Cupriavidus sp. CV2]